MRINEILTEQVQVGKKHLTHPEDLAAFYGTDGANYALNAIINTVKNPAQITIKYDGYPAIVWGWDSNGRFIVVDKHMFDKKDGSGRQIFSPQDFINYDTARGVDRSGLHGAIANAWQSLQQSTPKSPGYYWGDMLFGNTLSPVAQGNQQMYVFKANPRGLTYNIDVNSELGKMLQGKTVGIAVHQFIPATSVSAEDAVSLDGTLGNLKPKGNVAIIPAKLPITPQLKLNRNQINFVKTTINNNSQAVNALFETMPIAQNTWIASLVGPFINQELIRNSNLNDITKRSYKFILDKAPSNRMRSVLEPWLQQQQQGLAAMWTMWAALFNCKNILIPQLEQAAQASPVKGYLDTGVESQEGYVSSGVKFVDRLGFSAQIHAKR
jgi:hypothetical protein